MIQAMLRYRADSLERDAFHALLDPLIDRLASVSGTPPTAISVEVVAQGPSRNLPDVQLDALCSLPGEVSDDLAAQLRSLLVAGIPNELSVGVRLNLAQPAGAAIAGSAIPAPPGG